MSDTSLVESRALTPDQILTKSPDELWAQKIRQSAIHPEGPNPAAIVTLPDDDPQTAYDKLESGKKFIGKDRQVRVKPYTVANDSDFDRVPEGAIFVDPEGQIRTKPKYEPINYTAQTLYDMSMTDSEKKKALERSYPGKVKQDTLGEFYIDDDGVYRKPGHGLSSVTGFATAAALPTIGAVGGGLIGGAAANAPGAIGGSVAGSMLGQGFNDLILQASGVFDRSAGQELLNLGKAGGAALIGEGAGRGLAAFVPSVKAGMSKVGAAIPGAARKFLGATLENLQQNLALQEKGVMVPPSTTFKESPHIINIAERFDPGFRTQDPFLQSAQAHYEKAAKELLDKFGIKHEGPLIEPKSAVSTQPAGEMLLRRSLAESAKADLDFQAALDKRAAELQVGAREKVTQREAVLQTAVETRQKAQALIDQGFDNIRQDIDQAAKVSGAGGNSGELWSRVGKKLQEVKRAIQERHTLWYNQADQAAGGHLPDSAGLSGIAEDFLGQMPEGFAGRYPAIVKKMRDLAGVKNEATGEWIKPPAQPTFGQLHNLRSELRNNVRWYEIAPDMKDGVYKFFSKKVDDILHDPKAGEELRLAARLLDATDKSYAENMKIFNDSRVGAVIKGLESGEPADPKILFDTIVKEGRSDLTKKVQKLVGPNLWAGVKAADMQEMLDQSKGLFPGQIDGRAFVKQVWDRHRNNMLESVYGKEASEKLLEQARSIAMLEGKLDIPVRPGDTLMTIIGRARQAAEEAKRVANQDPLGTLTREMKKIEAARANVTAKTLAERRHDPLKFLFDPTTRANEAVTKILSSEDLILATAARFGDKSPEFNMLRQVYVQKMLQGTMQPSKALAKVSDRVQQLMFPGTTHEDIITLAKEMDFLLGAKVFQTGDMAGGMSTLSKVEHPIGGRIVSTATKMVPGVNTVGRFTLGKYYQIITDFVSKNPVLFHYLMRGLNGSEEEKQLVRKILSKHLQRGAAMGAGAGEASEQGGM